MKEGHTPDEVAVRVSYTARRVRTIVGPYSREGVQRISNYYLTLPRAKRLLTWDRQRELDEAFAVATFGRVIFALAWSPDRKRLATADSANVVRIWSASTGDLLGPFRLPLFDHPNSKCG